ncbi:hypothetical protein AYI68_g2702 [Smittium mucronatum]|uniref:Amine oxidase domain-containing protein n=1 Tax=Smittium mucronatum TaxID=133383 RepID=A0A1R0H203_9FUNG|nr:hypothetical protein AYI68_g2702 [Smittium mucronatum]
MTTPKPKKIAVVGSGLSGIMAAWGLTLYSPHEVTVFEKSNNILEYFSTVDFLPPGIPEKCTIDFLPETRVPVDIRPFVFNSDVSPNLAQVINFLRVELLKFSMDVGCTNWEIKSPSNPKDSLKNKDITPNHHKRSRSGPVPDLSEDQSGENQEIPIKIPPNPELSEIGRRILRKNSLLSKRRFSYEWNSSSTLGLFSQFTNIFRPRFYRAILDYIRFLAEICHHFGPVESNSESQLGVLEYLELKNYSKHFYNIFLEPIISCLLMNNNVKNVQSLPIWLVKTVFMTSVGKSLFFNPSFNSVKGGSRQFVRSVKTSLLDIKYNTEITKVVKKTHLGKPAGVVLYDSSGKSYEYDTLMPSAQRIWSSLNLVEATIENQKKACYTMWCNKMMDIDVPSHGLIFVSVNPSVEPASKMVISKADYTRLDLTLKKPELFSQRNAVNSETVLFVGSFYGLDTLEHGCYDGLATSQILGANLPFDLVKPTLWSDSDSSSASFFEKAFIFCFRYLYLVLSRLFDILDSYFLYLFVVVLGVSTYKLYY